MVYLTIGLHALFYNSYAFANPQGGQVVSGSATITTSPNVVLVNQSTNSSVINWQSFSVNAGEITQFNVPTSSSMTLNRVIGQQASQIFGSLKSNGRVILVNGAGIHFGPNSTVDVAGIMASTLNISNENFNAGKYIFNKDGTHLSSVVNDGVISTADGGFVALIAPVIVNNGTINARLGDVILASGKKVTMDFSGDGLINFAVDASEQVFDENGKEIQTSIKNTGSVIAKGGVVSLKGKTLDNVLDNIINVSGYIDVSDATVVGDEILLDGGDLKSTILIEGDNVKLSDESELIADGSGDGGIIHLSAKKLLQATGGISAFGYGGTGGNIKLDAEFAAFGGTINASGSSGGSVEVNSDYVSLGENIYAKGINSDGGIVKINAQDRTIAIASATVDVSGKVNGGAIYNVAAKQIYTSGDYYAKGITGKGGYIDVSAAIIKSLSSEFNASGFNGGGRVRIGGDYLGGKNIIRDSTTESNLFLFRDRWRSPLDELANAKEVILNDGTKLVADALSQHGDGGTIIVWSDSLTLASGNFSAIPGTSSGTGGAVEVSSGDVLGMDANIVSGYGNRFGTVLLDPANITIADFVYNNSLLSISPTLDAGDNFGNSVSLDGDRMAVGVFRDHGSANVASDSGAVYLYTFDAGFSNISLAAIIGKGYSGGSNYDLSTLDGFDNFGSGVSLSSNSLAVGASGDDNSTNSGGENGAVYLFTFSDANFTSSPTLQATIGSGYSGGKNYNLSLNIEDAFGSSVSLDGTRLAVGAVGDNSYGGAVYLFTFDDTSFTNPNLQANIGVGHNDVSGFSSGVESDDYFGASVSISGNNLVVGASSDDGSGNSAENTGAVHLFSFTNSAFGGGTYVASIGEGYTGLKDYNIDLRGTESSDVFGSSVSLDGTKLVVGALSDDGTSDSTSNRGAAYIFNFTDDEFSGVSLYATIGSDYSGGNNIAIGGSLNNGAQFGSGVSFDNDRLIVGAPGANSSYGAVFMFDSDSTSLSASSSYSDSSGSNLTITAASLADLLSSPQNITLQASNDITLSSVLFVDNSSGDGGNLILQAGRSVLLNNTITTDNGDFTVIANDLLVNGVVNGDRAAGSAVITQASGTTINTGTGDITFDLRSGTGKTNTASGDITLETITSTGTVSITNSGPTAGSDIIFNQDLTSSAIYNINSPVSLTANRSITSGNKAITFGSSATIDGGYTLTTNSGNANTVFGGAIGSTTPLTTLTISAANDVTFSDSLSAATLVLGTSSGSEGIAGDVKLQGNTTLTSGLTTFGEAYNFELTGSTASIAGLTYFLNTGTITLGDSTSDTLTFADGIIAFGNATDPSRSFLHAFIKSLNSQFVYGPTTLRGDSIIDTSSSGGIPTVSFGGEIAGNSHNLEIRGGTRAATTFKNVTDINSLTIASTKTLSIEGSVSVANFIQSSGSGSTTITNSSSLTASNSVSITSQSLVSNGSITVTGGPVTINVSETVTGNITSFGNATVTAATVSSSDITSTNGIVTINIIQSEADNITSLFQSSTNVLSSLRDTLYLLSSGAAGDSVRSKEKLKEALFDVSGMFASSSNSQSSTNTDSEEDEDEQNKEDDDSNSEEGNDNEANNN